jgi:hypothetical protein
MEPLQSDPNDELLRMQSPTLNELKSCQFSSWYPKFRALNTLNSSDASRQYPHNNITIRSKIISPLPSNFIDYLKSDGVILPKGAEKVSSFLPSDTNGDWSSDEEDEADADQNSSVDIHFPQLNQQIQNALDALGSCIPKLNWSAPKDVTWLNESTMKCSTVGDVYLLLKSSDFILHDLEHALSNVADDSEKGDEIETFKYELILRKWSNLHASMEFRCFVSSHALVGICQRNHTQHYPHLKREHMEIRAHIVDFYDTYIKENYADGNIENYVFDVYMDKNERIWLIDFNLWSTQTDALLFQWKELIQMAIDPSCSQAEAKGLDEEEDVVLIENVLPEIRVVMNENEVHYDPLASYRAPIDTVDLASDQAGSNTFKDFMAMCARPSDTNEDNDSE